jgi:hypothetical protein
MCNEERRSGAKTTSKLLQWEEELFVLEIEHVFGAEACGVERGVGDGLKEVWVEVLLSEVS